MQLGDTVTIHTYSKAWKGAQIVGVGEDTFGQGNPIFIVRHPDFGDGDDAHFYQQPNHEGKRLNVGNAAFWIEEE